MKLWVKKFELVEGQKGNRTDLNIWDGGTVLLYHVLTDCPNWNIILIIYGTAM